MVSSAVMCLDWGRGSDADHPIAAATAAAIAKSMARCLIFAILETSLLLINPCLPLWVGHAIAKSLAVKTSSG